MPAQRPIFFFFFPPNDLQDIAELTHIIANTQPKLAKTVPDPPKL